MEPYKAPRVDPIEETDRLTNRQTDNKTDDRTEERRRVLQGHLGSLVRTEPALGKTGHFLSKAETVGVRRLLLLQ